MGLEFEDMCENETWKSEGFMTPERPMRGKDKIVT